MRKLSFLVGLIAASGGAWALEANDADVVFLGEVHDNPAHHERQANWVAALAPKAVVYEMLTEAQALQVDPTLTEAGLAEALDWENSGWPDFSMYYPIFEASSQARVYGAVVPRSEVRSIKERSLDEVFGRDADRFGLTQGLPQDQQEAREAMQMEAHCNALPEVMLPMMVDIQRLRDAALARAAVAAYAETGGPVVVITGNGHARKDWGAPATLKAAAPDVVIYTLGQGEDGHDAPDGGFDALAFSPPAEREDPCAAFK